MSEKIKEYAIYPGQIKINNEIFFGLDYKLTDFYNELAEENKQLKSQLQQKENIIKDVREYITSYESIETIQQFDHNKNNKDLDYSTIDEMTRRYMMVHDKILEILDKVSDE